MIWLSAGSLLKISIFRNLHPQRSTSKQSFLLAVFHQHPQMSILESDHLQDKHTQTQSDLSIRSIQITLDFINHRIIYTGIYQWAKLFSLALFPDFSFKEILHTTEIVIIVRTKFFFKSLHSLGSSSTGTCSISTTLFGMGVVFSAFSTSISGLIATLDAEFDLDRDNPA